MRVPPPPRAMVPVLATVVGVIVAHTVDYAIVFPHAGMRRAHLDATGHGYWPVAVAAATAAAAAVILVAAARGARQGTCAAREPRRAWCRLSELLVIQGTAFTALEAAERGVAGLPPTVVLHSAEFWVGLALQLPVAWLALRLLDLVEHTAFKLAVSLHERRPRRAQRITRPVPVLVRAGLRQVAPAGPRAPPLGRS